MQTKHCWWCCVAELYMHVRVCVRAKRALRLSWSNFSVLSMCRWNAVLRSHPAVSASHSGWEKRPEGWMDERQEVLHAIEGGFSLATSLWAESAFLGLCAPMSVCVCVCVLTYVSAHMWAEENSHVEMCTATACSWMWVYAAHMEWTRGRCKRGQKDRQVNFKWLLR